MNSNLTEYEYLIKIIMNNHTSYNDQELSDKLHEAYSKIPLYMDVHNPIIDEILRERVNKYCENNNIDITDYQGCLPFRYYKIPVDNITREEAEKKILELMSEYKREENFFIPIKNNQ